MSWIHFTAWKVSVFGVFLFRIFPHSDWIRISPYSVRVRENKDQKNFKYGYSSLSVFSCCHLMKATTDSLFDYISQGAMKSKLQIKSFTESGFQKNCNFYNFSQTIFYQIILLFIILLVAKMISSLWPEVLVLISSNRKGFRWQYIGNQ